MLYASKSSPMSSTAALWVSQPIEIKSTPLELAKQAKLSDAYCPVSGHLGNG